MNYGFLREMILCWSGAGKDTLLAGVTGSKASLSTEEGGVLNGESICYIYKERPTQQTDLLAVYILNTYSTVQSFEVPVYY